MFSSIQNHKSHIFSVFQEGMKRIFKQKSHPYEVYDKRYEVMKSHNIHVSS